ncbi:putative zinc-binding protein [Pseudodesulfovibrio pelocollis]|uniref:putative zinc-binding protein n=1 Tax=Pseudodesulfovibrio pelocollis TaxID=3051432 RepID=UPI00255AB653|nr:putative zinc-binding protein [Pseudodesulfovibrio sp. SB368]
MIKPCACSAAPTLIFSCSGAADVGEIADRTARLLTRQGQGKMSCLAGIGGRVSGTIKSTEAAGRILAIDGCPQNCARKTLEEAGFTQYDHLQLDEIGLKKGASEPSAHTIELAAAKAAELLK